MPDPHKDDWNVVYNAVGTCYNVLIEQGQMTDADRVMAALARTISHPEGMKGDLRFVTVEGHPRYPYGETGYEHQAERWFKEGQAYSGFMTALYKACSVADTHNLAKLRGAFPGAVTAWLTRREQ